MNKFEGMNLPDLMEQMHGIVIPEPVSLVPQTIGWLVVMVWLFLMASVLGFHLYRKWKANAYRREASSRLTEIAAATDRSDAGYQIALLLKQTALAAYPRTKVASLSGKEWAEFLRTSSNDDAEVIRVADDLANAAYQDVTDIDTLLKPARRWIEVHRA